MILIWLQRTVLEMRLCGICFMWLLHENILHILMDPKQCDYHVDNTLLSLRQCVTIRNMFITYSEELVALAQHTLPHFLLSHGCLWMLQSLHWMYDLRIHHAILTGAPLLMVIHWVSENSLPLIFKTVLLSVRLKVLKTVHIWYSLLGHIAV